MNQIIKNRPIAIYHHGTRTDALFKAGEYKEIENSLKTLKKSGMPVGLATHMPNIIEYSEEHKWEVDFYMACVHNISKIDRISSEITGKQNNAEPFDDEDRPLMYNAIMEYVKALSCL